MPTASSARVAARVSKLDAVDVGLICRFLVRRLCVRQNDFATLPVGVVRAGWGFRTDADRIVVFGAGNQHPLAVAELERLEGAVRRVDEPQVRDAFAGIDGALAVQVMPARRVRDYLAHPVRRQRDVSRLGKIWHPLPAPAHPVRHNDVLAEVQLRLAR